MLAFLNMSGGEILLIVLVAYLVLGPKKIPEVARMIGKGINELRRATDDIRQEINKEVNNIKRETQVNIKEVLIPEEYNQKKESKPDSNINVEQVHEKEKKDISDTDLK